MIIIQLIALIQQHINRIPGRDMTSEIITNQEPGWQWEFQGIRNKIG